MTKFFLLFTEPHEIDMKRFFLIVVATVALFSCKVSQLPPDRQTYDLPDEDGVRIVVNKIFSVDDLVKAGYKKSKQFDVATVPGAVEVWYGFFNKKTLKFGFSSHMKQRWNSVRGQQKLF